MLETFYIETSWGHCLEILEKQKTLISTQRKLWHLVNVFQNFQNSFSYMRKTYLKVTKRWPDTLLLSLLLYLNNYLSICMESITHFHAMAASLFFYPLPLVLVSIKSIFTENDLIWMYILTVSLFLFFFIISSLIPEKQVYMSSSFSVVITYRQERISTFTFSAYLERIYI